MAEKFLWFSPFVSPELPCLARREDSNDAGPVVRFELVWAVDEDEAEGSTGQFWEEARDV